VGKNNPRGRLDWLDIAVSVSAGSGVGCDLATHTTVPAAATTPRISNAWVSDGNCRDAVLANAGRGLGRAFIDQHVRPAVPVHDRQMEAMGADRWQVVWPMAKETRVPPQVIPVNYLRWDVIDRGPGEDWGTQDVEAPHVRIVAMHPIDRGGGVVILGELLNEDVVPAFVTVRASLLGGKGAALATADSFDKISHVLLPKQVSPFRIDFPDVRLPQVDSVRIQPSSSLVAASADPVIGIESQKLNPVPDSSLTGELVNQSGQVVNVAHVLGTFYDNSGQIVWVSDQYPSAALLPQTPQPFTIPVPADVASRVKNYRVVVSTYSSDRLR